MQFMNDGVTAHTTPEYKGSENASTHYASVVSAKRLNKIDNTQL